jgi:SAM-dependent methyltransferase/uncharacterized protein YbaR (Trm112 family)
MTVEDQIKNAVLVCPVSKKSLKSSSIENILKTSDESHTYPLYRNVPILLEDREKIENYLRSSPEMLEEYEKIAFSSISRDLTKKLYSLFRTWYKNDLRNKKYVNAFNRIFSSLHENTVALSIGGGPQRTHNYLTNINIGPFHNVDVVGDAHKLPYADRSVDIIYCEAVLEHLSSPTLAITEFYRVLKNGGTALVITPFMQPYHGYPFHYQNFTLSGHLNLFKQQGFTIQESGTCVGPSYTLYHIVFSYIKEYVPFPLSLLRFLWGLFARVFIRQFDRLLNNKINSHKMASTTYLIAEKAIELT